MTGQPWSRTPGLSSRGCSTVVVRVLPKDETAGSTPVTRSEVSREIMQVPESPR
jgi:hypothetical protein